MESEDYTRGLIYALNLAISACDIVSAYYGTLSEGANEPEFSESLASEQGARLCSRAIRQLLKDAQD